MVSLVLATTSLFSACAEDEPQQPTLELAEPENHAPVLNPLQDRTVVEAESLEIQLEAFDPDGDTLTYSGSPLPASSSLNVTRGIFRWTPPYASAQQFPYRIEFRVTDGVETATQAVLIDVRPADFAVTAVTPDRMSDRGGVPISITGTAFSDPVTVRIGGRVMEDAEVVSSALITGTAPALPGFFGPVSVNLDFGNNRRLIALDAIFVYIDGGLAHFDAPRVAIAGPGDERDFAVGEFVTAGVQSVAIAGSGGVRLFDLDSGSFQLELQLDPATEVGAAALAVGRFDDDNRDDLAVLLGDGTVLVLRSARNWATEAPAIEATVVSVLTFDLEPDGDDELLILDTDGRVHNFATIAGAAFAPPRITEPSATAPAATALIDIGDLDGDGQADLLSADTEGLVWSAGVNTGAFKPARRVPNSLGSRGTTLLTIGEALRVVAVVDDALVFWSYDGVSDVDVTSRVIASTAPPPATEPQIWDISEDESIDVVWAGSAPGLRLDRQDGTAFEPVAWLMVGGSPLGVRLFDINSDGVSDTVWLSELPESLVIGAVRGRALPAVPLGFYEPEALGVLPADVFRDGLPEIILTGTEIDGVPVHRRYRVTSRAARPEPTALPSHQDVTAVVLADVTGNGHLDVISADTEGNIYCYPAIAPGSYGERATYAQEATATDLLLLPNSDAPTHLGVLADDGSLVLLTPDGNCDLHPTGLALQDVSAADVLQLLEPTLVVSRPDGTISLVDARTEHLLVPLRDLPVPQGVGAWHGAGDLDGDGARDLVVATTSGAWVFYDPLGSDLSRPLPANTPSGLAVGDLNGDAIDEVVITSSDTPPSLLSWDGQAWVQTDLPDWHIGRDPQLVDIDADADVDLLTFQDGFGAIVWRNVVSRE